MYNFCTVPKDSFHYWYYRIGVSNTWSIVTNDTKKEKVAVFDETTGMYQIDPNHKDQLVSGMNPDVLIRREFTQFKACRPEYYVGVHLDQQSIRSYTNPDDIVNDNMYDRILAGIIYMVSDSDRIAQTAVNKCLTWLHSTDFYAAPASTKYHESYPCGLIQHHLTVYNKMVELLGTETFDGKIKTASALLTALLHDWCKIDFYEMFNRNVKDEETGTWHQERAYKCKSSAIPLGHGVTSMFMAMKFFNLSTEQALAIRWHMQAYNVCKNEEFDLMDAAENYPMVRLLQLADQMAIIRE